MLSFDIELKNNEKVNINCFHLKSGDKEDDFFMRQRYIYKI